MVEYGTGPRLIPLSVIDHNEESLGVGGSRNNGIAYSQKYFSRGDLLYLSYNDVYFTEEWLDVLIEAYSLHGDTTKVIGGYCHPYSQPNWMSPPWARKGEVYRTTTRDAVGGASWLLSWNTWDKYGQLMDNARGTCQSEDYEYCQRIRKDGYEVGAVVPHVVYHTGRTDTFGKLSPGADVASPDVEGVTIE